MLRRTFSLLASLVVVAGTRAWAQVPQLLTDPPAVCLVRDGRMLRRNMRRELITASEVHAHLRGEGVDDISKVKRMFLESDGSFSVLQHSGR